MKKFYAFFIMMFLMNGAMAQWFPLNSGTTNILVSVYFTDRNTGYAVGDYGTILKTTNGGTNWNIVSSGPYSLLTVQFPVPDTGYAIGIDISSKGIVLRTIDAGDTWTIVSDSCSSLFWSFFTNSKTGYAGGYWMGPDWEFKTTDAGNSWDPIDIPGSQSSMYFPNSDIGYSVGSQINKTTDGGLTWSTIFSLSPSDSLWLQSVFFINSDTGYVVGTHGQSTVTSGVIMKTSDGGISWTNQSTGNPNSLNSVHFPEKNVGYVVGNGGTILHTTDGGDTWGNQTSGTLHPLYSVYFVNPDTGYIVGDGGIILKTTNGGVGINDRLQPSGMLATYPNPATTTITLESASKGQLTILNLSGQQLRQLEIKDQKTTVDISNLPGGVYLVKLVGEKGVQVGKFVKH